MPPVAQLREALEANCRAPWGHGAARHAAFWAPLKKTNRMDTQSTGQWMCLICGWIYDSALGAPEHGIEPGTAWEDVPMNWTCPECGARKEDFEMVPI